MLIFKQPEKEIDSFGTSAKISGDVKITEMVEMSKSRRYSVPGTHIQYKVLVRTC